MLIIIIIIIIKIIIIITKRTFILHKSVFIINHCMQMSFGYSALRGVMNVSCANYSII